MMLREKDIPTLMTTHTVIDVMAFLVVFVQIDLHLV